MPKLVFDTCCGCIELRSGCVIIAYFNLIIETVLLAVRITVGTAVVMEASAIATEEGSDNGVASLKFMVVLLIVFLICTAFTIVLLVGLHKHKRGHIKAYLIYAVILLVFSIFSCFAGSITIIVQRLAAVLVRLYFLLVIRSYYYKMDEKQPAVCSAA